MLYHIQNVLVFKLSINFSIDYGITPPPPPPAVPLWHFLARLFQVLRVVYLFFRATIPVRLQTHCMVKVDLDLLVFLPPPTQP